MSLIQNLKRNRKSEKEIYAEGFYLLYFGLMLMVIVRGLLLNHPSQSIWDISLLFLLSSFYLVIRFALQGSMHEPELEKGGSFNTRKAVWRGIISTLIFTAIMVFVGAWSLESLQDIFAVFVGMMVFFALSIILPYISYRRKENHLRE
ncbi:MAG: hypothetical protein D5S00_08030 [Tindallia sp. MSAO_Bac2]|nr:MAG: hypothetical protein D5S00_08030 [Tindallia sp. MSAO_Bac2]